MQVGLLGHASLLVESHGISCVVDPVFFDPFEEGAVMSCPKRVVHLERLPKIDVLVVSHRHPDHFDIPSLARLSRDCTAVCPADPLVIYALQKLGFAKINPVEQMVPIRFGELTLFPTRCEAPEVREFGMVFGDDRGVFWNQVDTFLSPETITVVLEEFGHIDLLFAMYASQNFEFFESRAKTFPAASHKNNLETVLRINPTMVAPGAAGFRFYGAHEWVNAFLFPISRERFAADLKRLAPDLRCQIMNPGDVFEISDGTVQHHPGASEVTVMVEEDTGLIRFDPTAPVPRLMDPNPDGHLLAVLKSVTDGFITQDFARYAQGGPEEGDQVLPRYREHGVKYSVDVIFPDQSTMAYDLDFGEKPPRLAMGNYRRAESDMVHHIAASALVGWIEHKKSFFYVRAYSRRHSTLFSRSRQGHDVLLESVQLPDLLMHFLLNRAAGSELATKHQVDSILRGLS